MIKFLLSLDKFEKIHWLVVLQWGVLWDFDISICNYLRLHDNDNDNENMFITTDLHIYRIQDARYQYTENKHLALFFLW